MSPDDTDPNLKPIRPDTPCPTCGQVKQTTPIKVVSFLILMIILAFVLLLVAKAGIAIWRA